MPNLGVPKLANVNTKINDLKYKRVMLTTVRMPDLGTTAFIMVIFVLNGLRL